LWDAVIPKHTARDQAGRATEISIYAGRLGDRTAPPPPPHSWAARPESDVAIWSITMAPGAEWTLPPAAAGTNRTLYLFGGGELHIAGQVLPARHGAALRPDLPAPLVAGADGADLLLLQGRPIGEPVAQYGPFVMNTRAEIQQAFMDYQQTQFGGWPWPSEAPVHGRDQARFARRPDGQVEKAAPPATDQAG
jgi:quercetin 2,3-dioxygenase